MSYQIIFSKEHKSIRRADNLHLGLKTTNGYLDSYLLRKQYHTGFGFLIGIPLSSHNVSILQLEQSQKANQLLAAGEEWIIPPFCLQHIFLGKEGAFKRIGKLQNKEVQFDPDNTAILGGRVKYDPPTRQFVPQTTPDRSPPRTQKDRTVRSVWPIEMFISGMAVREASAEERALPLVPWTVFSLGNLDLWLEQFRCWCLDLTIPTEVANTED